MSEPPSQKTTDEYGTVHWVNAAGDLHRTDGPAIEWPNGDCEWYINGVSHRTDGPAVEWANSRGWYQNGKKHRVDGPAVEWASGDGEWWLNGKRIELNPTVVSFIKNGLISLDQYVQCGKVLTYSQSVL